MEQAIRNVIDNISLPFHNDLIQNHEPVSFSQSLEKPLVILRWRFRICETCSEPFDIHTEGRFYQCGRCLDERN